MGENFQIYRAAVNAAKGIRQFQKADKDVGKENIDRAVRHFDKGLNFLVNALEHVENAADDAYDTAAKHLAKGNAELKKCMDAFDSNDMSAASKHYDKALEHYDAALDELDG
jgi:tetratricopeptide (TPR) repeat protein